MKKKLLVVYARYGSGHKSIAEYVANYVKDNNKNIDVMLLDITPFGNRLGKLSIKVFDWVLNRRQEFLFNTSYEMMDHKISTIGHNSFTKRCYDNKELRKLITDFNPDVTVSTHFYGSNLINYYNKIGITDSKLFTIITDYRAHECWTRNHKKEDGYIVGNEIVKEELVERGVSNKKIYPYGLPLNLTKMEMLDSKVDIIKRYNLDEHKKTYLFFGGSTSGSMYYYDYFKAICKLHLNKNIVFISGKCEKLKEKCESYVKKKKYRNVHVLGYTSDVFNLMKISSLVISKPGGATVTECMEMKVPMLLVPGIGGQEKYNARFIARKKYGIKVRGVYRFSKVLEKLENNPKMIDNMHKKMLELDKNKSIEKISKLISKV